MTAQDNFGEQIVDRRDNELLATVLKCQQIYAALSTAQAPDQQDELKSQYRALVERLYQLLEADLRRKARGWLGSGMATDLESLAKNMFTNIFLALPRLRVDPEKNLRNCLLTIAKRGIYDEYKRVYANRSDVSLGGVSPGDQEACAAHMWSEPQLQSSISRQDGTLGEIVDPESLEAIDRLAALIDNQRCLQAVLAFWQQTLSAVDRVIVELRMRELSFRDIASHLGNGWMEATVRKRYQRLLEKTRRYVQEQGLLIAPDSL